MPVEGERGAGVTQRLAVVRERVQELGDQVLDARTKGLFLNPGESLRAAEVAERKWNVLKGDLDLPLMLLKERELEHNIKVMADYCREHGVDLAPHGKTTMAPQLFARQLEAGAWGITAATAWQVRLMRSFGVPAILMANELVDPVAIAWILDELDAARGGEGAPFEFLCYVDSLAGIEIIEGVVSERASRTPLPVLVELGYDNGRSGVRSVPDALTVARRAAQSPAVSLRGVSAFEGLVPADSLEERLAAVQVYMDDLHRLVREVAEAGLCEGERIIVTSGGSSYFDIVTDTVGPAAFDVPVQTILRSGCYVTHDVEMYEETSFLGGRPGVGKGLLAQSLEVWATVWSRPRPDLAIVGIGKRDVPYDYRLPVPLRTSRPGVDGWQEVEGAFEVLALNDQHAFVRLPPESDLAVGDWLVSGISHPCGAFDKWAYLPVVDDSYTVVDGVFTFF
ncbi:alanine racemase [Nocardioides sp. LHD-245]|uniref:alanine racemase n=1 Tax=Nocardioides sp. LHD-245 TaxID=3051387 RepID=UPI0027E0F18E|nr:alanine racemase [Nocardioides sp. LHD-245]